MYSTNGASPRFFSSFYQGKHILYSSHGSLFLSIRPVAIKWSLIFLLSQKSWNSLPVKYLPLSANIGTVLLNINIADLNILLDESILRIWCSYSTLVKASTKSITYSFKSLLRLNFTVISMWIVCQGMFILGMGCRLACILPELHLKIWQIWQFSTNFRTYFFISSYQ